MMLRSVNNHKMLFFLPSQWYNKTTIMIMPTEKLICDFPACKVITRCPKFLAKPRMRWFFVRNLDQEIEMGPRLGWAANAIGYSDEWWVCDLMVRIICDIKFLINKVLWFFWPGKKMVLIISPILRNILKMCSVIITDFLQPSPLGTAITLEI